MKENRIYYQLTLRKFGESKNSTVIYTFNDSLEAYKAYVKFRNRYNSQEDLQKMRSAVEFYVIDRTSQGVKQLTTICACGYNIIDNYIENEEIYREIYARYLDGLQPP